MKHSSSNSKNVSINGTGIRRGFEGALVRFDTIHLKELDPRHNCDHIRSIRLLMDHAPIVKEGGYSPVNLIKRMRTASQLSYYEENPNFHIGSFKCPKFISQSSDDNSNMDPGIYDTSTYSLAKNPQGELYSGFILEYHRNVSVIKEKAAIFNENNGHLLDVCVSILEGLIDRYTCRLLLGFIIRVNWHKTYTENRHCEYLDVRGCRKSDYLTFIETSQKIKDKIYEQLTNRKHNKNGRGLNLRLWLQPYNKKVINYIKLVWIFTLVLIILSK